MQLSRVSQGAESHGRAPLPQMPPGPTSRERPFWAGHLGEPQAKAWKKKNLLATAPPLRLPCSLTWPWFLLSAQASRPGRNWEQRARQAVTGFLG